MWPLALVVLVALGLADASLPLCRVDDGTSPSPSSTPADPSVSPVPSTAPSPSARFDGRVTFFTNSKTLSVDVKRRNCYTIEPCFTVAQIGGEGDNASSQYNGPMSIDWSSFGVDDNIIFLTEAECMTEGVQKAKLYVYNASMGSSAKDSIKTSSVKSFVVLPATGPDPQLVSRYPYVCDA